MYALPVCIRRPSGSSFHDGTLFRLAPDLSTTAQMAFYESIGKTGISVCPQGHYILTEQNSAGDLYSLPGLVITDYRRPKRRFDPEIAFTLDQLKSFASSIISESERVQAASQAELALLIHDLRALSSAIINSAEAARQACEAGRIDVALDRVETVAATHTMLSIRIDVIDLLANQVNLEVTDRIPVFKKVDKVVRCFRPKAQAKNVAILLTGNSFAYTYGPTVFEVIVYSLLDNAVKYSPEECHINVNVREFADEIVVSFKSLGPAIAKNEEFKIFERGERGAAAKLTGQAGTGVGLNIASTILEGFFFGSISVHQEPRPRKTVGSVPYYLTDFEMIVPTEQALRA